jgi:hypothetical protein
MFSNFVTEEQLGSFSGEIMRVDDCSFARLVLFPLFSGISFPVSQYDSGLWNLA